MSPEAVARWERWCVYINLQGWDESDPRIGDALNKWENGEEPPEVKDE